MLDTKETRTSLYLSNAQYDINGCGKRIDGPHEFTANDLWQSQRHWLT